MSPFYPDIHFTFQLYSDINENFLRSRLLGIYGLLNRNNHCILARVVTTATRRVLLAEQELVTLSEHMSLFPVYMRFVLLSF